MRNRVGISTFLFMLVALVMLLFAIKGCGTTSQSIKDVPDTAVLEEGHSLMVQYCQSCHLLVDPDVLPKRIWENDVLPRMGNFLGFYPGTTRSELMEGGSARKILSDRHVFPEEPLLDSIKWKKIKHYILESSPDSIVSNHHLNLETREIVDIKESKVNINPPMSTMVQYEPASGLIYHGDVKGDYSTINIFDTNGAIVQSLGLRFPAVEVAEKPEGLVALLMGSFNSSDAPTGSIVVFSKANGSAEYNKMETVISGLRRPVDMEYADLDNDGDEDVIVSEFGNWAGQLRWFQNDGKGGFEPHVLLSLAGVTNSVAEDLNGDGLLDIMTLVAQGDESIYALLNKGNGQFDVRRLLRFPPTYGSVYFEYTDITGDGIKDIIHVSGDNADYEAVLKPYHGIRIYAGKPDTLSFGSPYTVPVNGAYKTQLADFDSDGDKDMAVISFFPDYSTGAQESLIMLENTSENDSMSFQPFTINGFDQGRFNVMSSGDVNGDGMQDLILGSFVIDDPYSKQKVVRKSTKKFPMLLILENKWKDMLSAIQD